jgi:O-acetyl-ADP-ribose deacetylase (regulator of RNase III)
MTPPVEKITFVDLNEEVISALRVQFADVPEADFVVGPFEKADFDYIVSPANGFGLMDGGFDGALTRRYGQQLAERVQERILRDFAGEQPVGTAFVTNLTDERVVGHPQTPNAGPWLIHAPTMRVPADIRGTSNVYAAMKAILLAVRDHPRFVAGRRLATPGLGTLTGRMTAEAAATQMRQAWEHVGQPPTSISWQFATGRDEQLKGLARNSRKYDSPQQSAKLTGFLS